MQPPFFFVPLSAARVKPGPWAAGSYDANLLLHHSCARQAFSKEGWCAPLAVVASSAARAPHLHAWAAEALGSCRATPQRGDSLQRTDSA